MAALPHGDVPRLPHPARALAKLHVDHLVPIELGGVPFGVVRGAWDLRNVWPEPKTEVPEKDAVENALHAAVCYRRGSRSVHLELIDAQRAIAHDWMRTPVGMPPIENDRSSSFRD